MKLYSYIVARDFGFAPNPFHGYCTLATCKPDIRSTADVGDWIMGTGSKKFGLDGHLVFAMKISEKITFDEYWSDERFVVKRPCMNGSLNRAYGDNIYHRDPETFQWLQEDSHHSFEDGTQNLENTNHDTRCENVLVGKSYWYYGGSGPEIPSKFRNPTDVCLSGQGHKYNFPEELRDAVIGWLLDLGQTGYIASPKEFGRDEPTPYATLF